MSASNVSGPWFQGDYRSSSPFRGGKTPSDWGQERGGRYAESTSAIRDLPVADSGVGSMSPSPPKTPTPDYDSLEDIFDGEDDTLDTGPPLSREDPSFSRITEGDVPYQSRVTDDASLSKMAPSTADGFPSMSRMTVNGVPYQSRMTNGTPPSLVPKIVDGVPSVSKMTDGVPYQCRMANGALMSTVVDGVPCSNPTDPKSNNQANKKVHFLSTDTAVKSTSSWRDALVVSPVDQLSFCYRQDWAQSKASGPPRTMTLAEEHLDHPRRSKRGRLVRRSSSLDRLADLRYSYRTPLLCDPDPLKVKKKRIVGRKEDGSSHKPAASGGPPLKQLRSYSVENAHSSFAGQLGQRSRQRSVSGNVSSKKTPVRRVDDDALKRSRLHSSQYELSQDLLDKQVEMLERKYGGVCARKAALTIQRAFRKYTIMKRFQDIANASKGESKRLSRRFPTYDLENKEWVVWDNGSGTVSRYPHHHLNGEHAPLHHQLDQYGDVLCRELGESLEANRFAKRTQSFRERRIKCDPDQDTHHPKQPHHLTNSAYYSSANNARSTPPAFPRHPAWSAVPGANIQRTCPSVYVNSSSPSVKNQQQDSNTFQQPPPRDSVSSEDSALSLMSVEGESDGSTMQRGSAVRHSIGVSPSKHLQRATPVRSSDAALGRRVPPQVPKRTSSIPGQDPCENGQKKTVDASPVWKRKSLVLAEQSTVSAEDKRLSNISENSEDSLDSGGGYSNTAPADMSHSFNVNNYPDVRTPHDLPTIYKLTEIQRKRQYRVGLNLFNKRPERGVRYLVGRGFLEAAPQAVARFLLTRKGLSKQMIGEYLGNLQNSFNMAVLECFVQELDLAGMQVDVALRKFQTFFRMPGEAQKIERLVEVFSHRYVDCNHDIASKFQSADTVFVLAFAIIMLNTDLHTPNMKAERRMKAEEFIRNLRAIDDGHDLDRDMLLGIYERIKTNEFKMGSDHVTQVLKVQQTIVGKKPNLALPHRRLVCYCRLYEVYDVSKKERPGVHQREVFLFNDLLMVTKIFSKKKNSVTYTFRQSFPLCGMSVTLFEAPYYPHGIRLSQRVDDKVLITFNARNEHDRSKFVEDLKESILEMDEMENLRIEGELEKQKMMRGVRGAENRDSGVADMEMVHTPHVTSKDLSPESANNNLKRSALSNSLLDLHEQQISKPVRRGSAGSLDSGMSISFQSSAASSVSHDSSPQMMAGSASSGSGSSLAGGSKQQAGFLGGWFGKRRLRKDDGPP